MSIINNIDNNNNDNYNNKYSKKKKMFLCRRTFDKVIVFSKT